MTRPAFLLPLLLALAACGGRGALERTAEQGPQPQPYWSRSDTPRSDSGLIPPAEAMPDRSDAVTGRPERERQEDPFDLPPTAR